MNHLISNILFCNNPLDTKSVDMDFQGEYVCAKEAGFSTEFLNYENLVNDRDVEAAIRHIPVSDKMEGIIYRGWMLKPSHYALLYDALQLKNFQLINSRVEYQNCHYLPDSYPFIKDHTPRTVWIPMKNQHVDDEQLFTAIEVFADAPLVVKDYVKSQKHYWDTACFIPSASDHDKVKLIVDNFIGLQGNDLNEGLVIREFVDLSDLSIHTKSRMPLKQEYRLFFLNHHFLNSYPYWEEGSYLTEEHLPINLFENIAQKIESNFFSMDVAMTKNGRWIIIELGDGQVTGLPDRADMKQFYSLLKTSSGS